VGSWAAAGTASIAAAEIHNIALSAFTALALVVMAPPGVRRIQLAIHCTAPAPPAADKLGNCAALQSPNIAFSKHTLSAT
jgi:hypothetical protein